VAVKLRVLVMVFSGKRSTIGKHFCTFCLEDLSRLGEDEGRWLGKAHDEEFTDFFSPSHPRKSKPRTGEKGKNDARPKAGDSWHWTTSVLPLAAVKSHHLKLHFGAHPSHCPTQDECPFVLFCPDMRGVAGS
jgi:hypothetical protein